MARRKLYDEHGNEVQVKRRGGCLKWLGIGILLIVFVAYGYSANVSEESGSSTEPQSANVNPVVPQVENTEQEDTVEAEQTYSIGDTIRAGDLSVAVNGASNTDLIESSFTQEVPSTGNYLLVDLTVRNDGNEAITVDSNNFKLVKGETVYSSDGTATLYANEDSTSFFLNSLNPEATLSGTVAFDISQNSANDPDLQLEISSNMFFGEKVYVDLH